MLKNLLTIAVIILTATNSFAQSCEYTEYLGVLREAGYTIGDTYKVNCARGEQGYQFRTLTAGLTYTIVGSSDDLSVTDVDLYLYEADGVTLIKGDTGVSNLAVIKFIPATTRVFKIMIKNYASTTPNFESTHRFIVAFK